MGMTMTQEQRKVFDEGVKFSFELFKNYIEKHWLKECKTSDEKRDFFFDIWNFIEAFHGNISSYQMIDKVVLEKNISEDDRFFFEEGISDHRRYVKYCLQNDELSTVVEHFKDYFSGKISSLPNKNYPTYEDWINAPD